MQAEIERLLYGGVFDAQTAEGKSQKSLHTRLSGWVWRDSP